MKRPIGLILSAIVLSLAALFLLLLSALMAFSSIFARRQPSMTASPNFLIYFMIAFSVFYAVLAVWAILTVIGIVRLRSWARYSILIIGGGLAAFSLLAIFGTIVARAMLPTLQTQQPAVDPHRMSVVFLVMGALYLSLTVIGAWWLTYFNLRSIRELFSNPSSLIHSPNGSSFSRTPTGIKIIGGLLLISALFCLIWALLPFPAFLMGFIIPSPANHVLYLGFAALAAWIGYGLLRLKESARLVTIGYLVFGCGNLVLAALPWYQARFWIYMTQFTAVMPRMPGQAPLSFTYSRTLILISCLFVLVVYGLVFWQLRRHRAAFQAPPPPPMLEA